MEAMTWSSESWKLSARSCVCTSAFPEAPAAPPDQGAGLILQRGADLGRLNSTTGT